MKNLKETIKFNISEKWKGIDALCIPSSNVIPMKTRDI